MSVSDAQRRALWRTGLRLEREGRRANRSRGLPTVFLFTDPLRTPDPARTAIRLPRGTGVVFRSFGRSEVLAESSGLAQASKRRRLFLLIGSDERLAARMGAKGVHLPERELWRARGLRQRHPHWVISGAAHSALAVRAGQSCGLDAIFLSAVFESNSPSAGRPIGPLRMAKMIQGIRTPIYALGGVNGLTARRLLGAGVAGFAAVEALEAEASGFS